MQNQTLLLAVGIGLVACGAVNPLAGDHQDADATGVDQVFELNAPEANDAAACTARGDALAAQLKEQFGFDVVRVNASYADHHDWGGPFCLLTFEYRSATKLAVHHQGFGPDHHPTPGWGFQSAAACQAATPDQVRFFQQATPAVLLGTGCSYFTMHGWEMWNFELSAIAPDPIPFEVLWYGAPTSRPLLEAKKKAVYTARGAVEFAQNGGGEVSAYVPTGRDPDEFQSLSAAYYHAFVAEADCVVASERFIRRLDAVLDLEVLDRGCESAVDGYDVFATFFQVSGLKLGELSGSQWTFLTLDECLSTAADEESRDPAQISLCHQQRMGDHAFELMRLNYTQGP